MFELKKWEPLKELSHIQKEMDELFRRTFGGFTSAILRKELRGLWRPDMDCYFSDNKFIVHADLPGIDPKDIEVTISGNLLTVRGERKSEVEEKKGAEYFHESTYGAFERTVTLPEGVDTETVKASYKNGVLELAMNAKPQAMPKKVKIETEEGKEGKKAA